MNLKKLFVKEDALEEIKEDVQKSQKQTVATKQVAVTPTAITSVNNVSTPMATIEQKNEFLEFLNEVYQKGNFPGPDYQEFTDALKEVESAPIDEKTKFTTIFVGFKVQGVTKTKLLDTGAKYITLIQNQSVDFGKQVDTEITTMQSNITKLIRDNDEIEKQMIALTEKRNKNNDAISVANNEIAIFNSKKAGFDGAASDFIMKVQTTLEKIKTYLPDSTK